MARLPQLSDQAERLAATLARIKSGASAPPMSLDAVQRTIRARRLRTQFFDENMFSDPAWDILLELLRAEIAQQRVAVTSVSIAAHVPMTTSLRFIQMMTDAGLLLRRPDPHDRRRAFVELSPSASISLRHYFNSV